MDLLEVLFDRMPMGIVILDRDFRVRRCNPTWRVFIDRYTSSSHSQAVPGANYLDLVPGAEETVLPLLKRVLKGETIRRDALRLDSGGVVSYFDRVLAPLMEHGKVAGIVSVMTDATERELAYRNLEDRVEERTRELERRSRVHEGLDEILAILNSNRPLGEVLDYIVGEAGRLLETGTVSICRWESAGGAFRLQAARGFDADFVAGMEFPASGIVAPTVLKRQPLVIPDLSAIMPEALRTVSDPKQRELRRKLSARFQAILAVPLIVKDEVYGGLILFYPEKHDFTDEEIELAMTLSDHAALAIENARLRDKVEEAAVAAERSRLARDLHDAVTQTLFSASLIAEVLPRLWEQNPDEGKKRLGELRSLTRGALAEMRALLVELRPQALLETELSELLRQLTEAVTGGAGVPVAFTVDGSFEFPPDVKIAFYRVAQEALNNVVRHSGASGAEVSLCGDSGRMEMCITDNGRGFSTKTKRAESLGLGIMKERAQDIGADLRIESRTGRGTRVRIVWHSEQANEGSGRKPRMDGGRKGE